MAAVKAASNHLAARLEGIAEPGAICISGTVYEHIRDKLPFAFTDRGEQTFKNIAHPVRVYALGPDALAAMADVPTSTENYTAAFAGLCRSGPAAPRCLRSQSACGLPPSRPKALN